MLLSVMMLVAWLRGGIDMTIVLWVGIAARLLLIPAPPITSNDIERYLWDGAVLLGGYDPYTTPANSPLVAGLRELWPTPIEHEKYATLYPPVALTLFALSALAGPTLAPFVWKLLTATAGIAALFIVRDILHRRSLMRHFPLFALSPLLILEGGVGAHVDNFSVLAIVCAIAALDHKKPLWAGIVIGVGTSIKLLPFLLLGPLFLAYWRKGALQIVAGAVLAIIIIYGAALLTGYQAIGILPTFFEKWRFGSPLYMLLEIIAPAHAIFPTQVIIAVLLFTAAAIAAVRDRVVIALSITLAVPLLISPVVFPWYLVILIPMIALRPSATLLAWVTVAPIGYVVLNRWVSEGVWEPATWAIWAVGAAILFGFIAELTGAKTFRDLPRAPY